ncbi:iron-hydroxamate ABC transporter substrate-binding protein [Paraliobacillus sp. PM-2]|uniref:iron-hydroxamate ABC transporter substrate-binding protein n=1 Tax=Paraliobacillus sp. PM-2 TaxID=1462524 RepID=UPI000B87E662|nr:iron-hydroxamate ABC transporter substrate-binding protein [Paraliobacillus sp. PM-2]
MKKIFMLLAMLVFIAGCTNQTEETENTGDKETTETVTYESENGPVEVPANPKRVAVLSTFAGNLMELDINLVGVDSWSKMNPNFDEELADVEEVSDESLEKLLELEPDLIIGLSNINNADKLKEIAPTVTFTYNKVDYLTQHIEIGKLVNKEEEARKWVEDFKARANRIGEDIKAKIGKDATVTVIENFEKQLYVFGDNWGRGTEILYQQMGLKMPEKVKEMALTDGYYAISPEVLPEYAGDYMIFSKNTETDTSFQETETYKNIPAVKKDHVYEVDAQTFYFNDATTLDYQLDFFEKSFLENE